MLLEDLESRIITTKDFQLLDNSFKEGEHTSCPNLAHSVANVLQSNNVCVIRWALYRFTFDMKSEKHLLNLLSNLDDYVCYKSFAVLTSLYKNTIPPEEYFLFAKSKLNMCKSYCEITQIYSLLTFLMTNERNSFKYEDGKCIDRNILKIQYLKDEENLKLLKNYILQEETVYYLMKLIYIMSFDATCLGILYESKIVDRILQILLSNPRVKVIRLAVPVINKVMERKVKFSFYTLDKLAEFTNRIYEDEDLNSDVFHLKNTVSNFIKRTNPIDNYLAELFSGELEESPYHFDESFWETNIDVLIENKIEIIKAIKKYIKSDVVKYMWIASNDVYMFVKYAPEIGDTIIKYGLKEDLFELTNVNDEDVKFHAVQALAVCILTDWS